VRRRSAVDQRKVPPLVSSSAGLPIAPEIRSGGELGSDLLDLS